MALPTWSQVWTQIQNVVKLHEDQRTSFAGTYLTQENVVNSGTNLLSYNAAALSQAVAKQRGTLDAFLQQERAALDSLLVELGRIMGVPETDSPSLLLRLTTYMVDNPAAISPGPPRIASRQISRGSFVKGSPFVGSGTIYRLFVDPYGNCLESGFADVISVRCVSDRQSGSDPGRELFEFRGQPRPDTVTYYQSGYGSGITTGVRAVSADDTATLVLNPSFSDFSGTTSVPTGITNWEFFTGGAWVTTSAPNSQVDQNTASANNIYRAALLENTPASLRITATQNIRQRFSTRRAVLSAFTPYYCQLAWRCDLGSGGAATGTITLKLGTNSVSVTVSGQTGWQILQLKLDKNLYFKNWDTDDASLEIDCTVTSGANTWFNLDDLVLAPFKPYDGHWVEPVGGATPFLYYDTGSFTDTELGAKIQRHVQRLYGYSLPSSPVAPAGAPTLATTTSAVTVGTTGHFLTSGTHVAAYTLVDTQGVESSPSPVSGSVSFNGTTQYANVTGLPASPGTNIATLNIYLSKAGTSTPLFTGSPAGSVTAGTTSAIVGYTDADLVTQSGNGVTINDPS